MAKPLTAEELKIFVESADDTLMHANDNRPLKRPWMRERLRWHATVKALQARVAELEGECRSLVYRADYSSDEWEREYCRRKQHQARADMWRDRSWAQPAEEGE